MLVHGTWVNAGNQGEVKHFDHSIWAPHLMQDNAMLNFKFGLTLQTAKARDASNHSKKTLRYEPTPCEQTDWSNARDLWLEPSRY